MARRTEGLTAAGVKHVGPGVHGDGGGLYLRVKPDGRASWALRYQITGVRRDLGLGRARGPGAVSLAEARGKAAEARWLMAEGRDPLAVREAEAVARREAEAARERQARNSIRDVAVPVPAQTPRRQRLPGPQVPGRAARRLRPDQPRDRQAIRPPQVRCPAEALDRREDHRLAQPLSPLGQRLGVLLD